MVNRKDKRINKKFIVSFDVDGFEKLGLVQNISKSGICIASETCVPEEKEIIISIAVPGEIYNLKGEIAWCKSSENKSDTVPDSMGIRITEAPSEYLNFIEYLKHQNIVQGQPEF